MKELLERLGACEDARKWADGKTWQEVYDTCERGDWLLWLFKRTNPDDVQLNCLAGGHCANSVRHLMKDERLLTAVDAAIAFGEGRITKMELEEAASAAAWAAVMAASWAAMAAWWAAALAASWAAMAAATADNQKTTAYIVRKYIPITKFNIEL